MNNYYNTDDAGTTLAVPSIVKYAPSVASAPIGTETTFDLVVTLPEGTTKNLVVTDDLPYGLDPVGYLVITTGGRLGQHQGQRRARFGKPVLESQRPANVWQVIATGRFHPEGRLLNLLSVAQPVMRMSSPSAALTNFVNA